MNKVIVTNHPLIQHKLTIMRDKETGTKDFRELLNELTMLMAYESTRDLELEDVEVETPVAKATLKKLAGKKLCLVPVLRAGLGMLDGFLKMIPAAKVGHVGLSRNPETLEPEEYFVKFPENTEERDVIIIDPMLATGGSSVAAIDVVKKAGAKSVRLVNLVAAPEGIAKVHEHHPDVDIYVASVDEKLNEHAYIVPGLGDAGDRLFGTK